MARQDSTDDTSSNLEELSVTSTPMREFFEAKTVFLTGGTGFLGQLFVEKLLRSGVKKLYILMRQKKGKCVRDRLADLYSGPLFSKLKNTDEKYLNRIKVVEGDIGKANLDLAGDVLQTLFDEVEMIIHAAADVRFDQVLTKTVEVNVKGTRELLNIAATTKNLQVFTYISTAYSHCPRENIDEKFYEPPIDPEIMIRFVEKQENNLDHRFDILQERMVLPWPNNYTYSKSLSEELVRHYSDKFPILVMRPTIVISTYEDPIPAWCNNIYGLNGILVACGMGVLRMFPCNRRYVGDIVCADFVVNSTLAAMWATYENYQEKKPLENPKIYHVSSCCDAPLTWGTINDQMKKVFSEYPAKEMLWKECPNSTTCPFMMKILTIYYHVIPAIFFDMYLSVTNQKIRMMPVYRKVQRFLAALKHFMSTEWKFSNSNMHAVIARMSKGDQNFFPCDIRQFDWSEYSYQYTHGLKLYIANDSPDNIVKARIKYKRLVVFHYIVLCLYYVIHLSICYFALKYFKILNFK